VAPRSKVELFAAIRRDSRAGLSVRELARKYRVHQRTVREALTSAWPAPRKKLPPRKSRLDPFKPAIDAMLRVDLDAPRKQRHTVKRIYDRLVAEHGLEGLSYDTVWEYVQWRRSQIAAEAGRGPERVFIPQSHQPGAEGGVDFSDVYILLAGALTKCWLFTFRLSYSGKAVHRVFASCGLEAKVFLRDSLGGNYVKRWITSPATMDRFQFDWGKINHWNVPLSAIGYPDGPDISWP
jgi:transposase